jgi:hypothetical protein
MAKSKAVQIATHRFMTILLVVHLSLRGRLEFR